jgi:hypothetical protein
MKARYQLNLDGVGCLSLLVLTGAIHWFLASRFPERGAGLGALLWLASIGLGLFVVARAVGRDAKRDERARLVKLAGAPCPSCGAPIGEERAAAMRDNWKAAAARAVAEGMAQGLKVNPDRTWRGACAACGEGIAYAPDSGEVTRARAAE